MESLTAKTTKLMFVLLLVSTLSPGCPAPPTGNTVPNVVGLSRFTAQAAITQAGFVVGEVSEEFSDTYPAERVIRQDPTGGTAAQVGAVVDLVISKGPDSNPEPGTVRIQGQVVNGPVQEASVKLFALGGSGALQTATTDRNGTYTFDADESLLGSGYRLEASGGTVYGAPNEDLLIAIYSPDHLAPTCNLTPITTLVHRLAESGHVEGETALERQEAALERITSIGMAGEDDWWAFQPDWVDLESLLGAIRQSGGLENWLEVMTSALTVPELLPEHAAGFPNAHGGVLSASLTGNALQGEPFRRNIQVVSAFPVSPIYVFTLLSGPPGMDVSADGLLTYEVPADAPPGPIELDVRITNAETDRYRDLSLEFHVVDTDIVVEGTVGPEGGVLADEWDVLALEVPEGAVQSDVVFQVVRGTDQDGLFEYTMRTIPNDILLARTPKLRIPTSNARSIKVVPTLEPDAELEDGANKGNSGFELWHENPGMFLEKFLLFDHNRVPASAEYLLEGDLRYEEEIASQVWSYCGAIADFQMSDCSGRVPVLFVHGYTLYGLGGGQSTWGTFRELLHDAGFAVFEFQYRSNARFQELAADLAVALRLIRNETGQKVHIVAHSFGGLVSRTYMQGLASISYRDEVASLVTLGTPHSGIAEAAVEFHGRQLPNGTDGVIGSGIDFRLSKQLTVYQAGSEIRLGALGSSSPFNPLSSNTLLRELYGVAAEPGEIVAALANVEDRPLPAPVNVLIGLTTFQRTAHTTGVIHSYLGEGRTLNAGDGLISFQGQRFHPQLSCVGDDCEDRELSDGPISDIDAGNRVYEKLLYFPTDLQPGETIRSPYFANHPGYSHTAEFLVGIPEVHVTNSDVFHVTPTPGSHSDKNYAYYEVLTWLLSHGTGASSPESLVARFKVIDADTAAGIEGAGATLSAGGNPLATASTGAGGDGEVEAPFISSTTHSLIVSAPGYRTEEFDNALTTGSEPSSGMYELGEIHLQPDSSARGTVAGFVVAQSSNQAISGAECQLTNGAVTHTGVTDENGFYQINGVARGSWTLQITRSGYRPGQKSVVVVPSVVNNGSISLLEVDGQISTIPTVFAWDPDEYGWVGNISAYFWATIEDDGGSDILETAIGWGTQQNGDDWQWRRFSNSDLYPSYAVIVEGLDVGTRHYMQAFARNATNPDEWGHSEFHSFNTSWQQNKASLAPRIYSTSSPSRVHSVGDAYWIRKSIANLGDIDAGASHVEAYLTTRNAHDISDTYFLGERVVPSLRPAEEAWAQWDFVMPALAEGDFEFWILTVVDSKGTVEEINENNIWKSLASYQGTNGNKSRKTWHPTNSIDTDSRAVGRPGGNLISPQTSSAYDVKIRNTQEK